MNKPLNNVKFVTRRAKLRMMNTTASLGTTAQGHAAYTTVRHLRLKEMKALKTTKFIPSRPVIVFRGEPPF